MMRRVLKMLVIGALLVAGLAVAGRAYLGSEAAAGQVAARIAAALGTRVTVGGLRVNMNGSAAIDVAIYEVDSQPTDPPLLTIGRADTDIGLPDMIRGATDPGIVTLRDVKLLIRHDREGLLLTKVPHPSGADRPLPKVRIERAGLTIRREGDADVTFQGLDADVNEAEGRVQVVGKVDDPNWGGVWQFRGDAPKAGGTANVRLQSQGVNVTQAMLRRVPYVSENIWNHVELEGHTPVDLQLLVPKAPAKTRYRVTLTPVNTAVYVPSIDLRAGAAAGKVVVEDGLVLLREVRGRVAEGELQLPSADLDFRPANGSILKFEIDAARLILQALPRSWRLPPRLGGRLTGKATLVVRVIDRIPIVTGSGDGRVDDAFIGPIPVPNYGLRIQADRNGILFEPRIGLR